MDGMMDRHTDEGEAAMEHTNKLLYQPLTKEVRTAIQWGRKNSLRDRTIT